MKGSFLVFASLLSVGSAAAQLSVGSTAALGTWDGKILNVRRGSEISSEELTQGLRHARNVILGEKHYSAAIQNAQARVIEWVVKSTVSQNRFTLAWEFLNVSDRARTDREYGRLESGETSVEEFLNNTQGNSDSGSYAPIFTAAKDLGGAVLGVNLSRSEKAPVVQGGIAAAKPGLVPPGFALGGYFYFERFATSMVGHASEENLRNYFAAQCLTDDVMAYHLLGDSRTDLRFLVTGEFHSDYLDGVVARLKARAPEQETQAIRFVDASDHTEEELRDLPKDPKYGPIADYVIFSGEPRQH
jgi:uncharacterized iron-regulated protein